MKEFKTHKEVLNELYYESNPNWEAIRQYERFLEIIKTNDDEEEQK